MVEHKILIVSNGFFEQDGRLRELVEIAQLIGEVHLISRSKIKAFENHYVYQSNSNNYARFVQFCRRVANNISNLTVVLADNRKALIPAWLIAKKFPNVSSVSDSRELYIVKDVKHLVGKIGCYVEKFCYKRFDVIISANEERARLMKMLYKLSEYPLVYENIRKLNYSSSVKVEDLKRKFEDYFIPNGSKRIISTAGYSFGRGGKKLIEEIGALGNGYSLYIVGGGTQEESIQYKKFITENKFDNIHDVGRLDSDELKYFIQNCDIGVVFYHKNDLNNKYCASGKVYEFMFEGVPLICSDNIPLVRVCKQYQIGVAGNSFSESAKEVAKNIDQYRQNIRGAIPLFDIENNRETLADQIKSRISNDR